MIKYDDIFKRCEELSSYEAGRAYNTNGESLYEVVHLTSQDKILVMDYIRQSAHAITNALRYIVDDVDIHGIGIDGDTSGSGLELTFNSDSSIVYKASLDSDLESVFASYIMWQWLDSRLPERAKAWQQIYEAQIAALKRGFKRKKPAL